MNFIARILLWTAIFPFLVLVIITHDEDTATEVHAGFGSLIDTLLSE